MLEFLGLPTTHSEADLHASPLERPREFLNELSRDFCFVGLGFPMRVVALEKSGEHRCRAVGAHPVSASTYGRITLIIRLTLA
jgi:predicted nuclease of restriction endonuclease-like (RecB) superfamily